VDQEEKHKLFLHYYLVKTMESGQATFVAIVVFGVLTLAANILFMVYIPAILAELKTLVHTVKYVAVSLPHCLASPSCSPLTCSSSSSSSSSSSTSTSRNTCSSHSTHPRSSTCKQVTVPNDCTRQAAISFQTHHDQKRLEQDLLVCRSV